jgi:hypothetical protein
MKQDPGHKDQATQYKIESPRICACLIYITVVLYFCITILYLSFLWHYLGTDSPFVTSKIHIISAFINPGLQAIIHA